MVVRFLPDIMDQQTQITGTIMTQRTIVDRGVVILPPEDVTERAITLSELLGARFSTSVVLNATNRLPHITKHQFSLPEDRLGDLEVAVAKVAKDTLRNPLVELVSIGSFGDGGIFWDARVGYSSLWNLHLCLIREILPLQEEYRLPHLLPLLTGEVPATMEERIAFLRYGNPLANPRRPEKPYRPHVTLSKLNNPADMNDAIAFLNEQNHRMDCAASSIHITELGPSGTCPGSLKEFKFRE